jgi:hypothetical protein
MDFYFESEQNCLGKEQDSKKTCTKFGLCPR